MPCNTISTVSVNLGKVNADLFFAALTDLGLYPYRDGCIISFGRGESLNTKTQELRVRSQDFVVKLKQSYSAQVVKSQAKKFGWQLKETSPFNYQVVKR